MVLEVVLPAPHAWHDVWPAASANLPAPHSLHSPDHVQNLPTSQSVQTFALGPIAPAAVVLPTGHDVHRSSEDPAEPGSAEVS